MKIHNSLVHLVAYVAIKCTSYQLLFAYIMLPIIFPFILQYYLGRALLWARPTSIPWPMYIYIYICYQWNVYLQCLFGIVSMRLFATPGQSIYLKTMLSLYIPIYKLFHHTTRGIWKVLSTVQYLSNRLTNPFMCGIILNSCLCSLLWNKFEMECM